MLYLLFVIWKEFLLMQKYYRYIRQVTCLGFLFVLFFAGQTFYDSIPEVMYINAGEEVRYDFALPVSVVLKDDSRQVLTQLSGGIREGREISYTVTCKLLGIFPVKDIEVNVLEGKEVYASGMPIGIYTKTKGILVIDSGEFVSVSGEKVRPAANRVKGGDYIVSVNGESVSEKESLIEKIDAYGAEKEVLGIQRDDEYIEVAVDPVKSEDGSYMLGIWVRDDLAGVGTMTYFDEEGDFGALGHAVSDGDTGTQMQISEGWIYLTNIIGIRKGEDGNPGELSGIINYSKDCCLGTIHENSKIGIYGNLDGDLTNLAAGTGYEVAYKQDIRVGAAYILSSLSGENKSYEIEIENIDYSGREANKGILFRVTDRELLDLTGGIVQGMSGSPIIQDGRMIGAVTHVFVSDSTKGYGIFIENMMEH